MTVDTTFLPKTNGLVFGDRLVARSDKGRVFLMGVTPPPPTIGDLTVTPSDAALSSGSEQEFTSAFTGDATDVTYAWSIRSGNAQLVSPNTTSPTCTYSFINAGAVQVQCTVSSATASDSPASFVSMMIVS